MAIGTTAPSTFHRIKKTNLSREVSLLHAILSCISRLGIGASPIPTFQHSPFGKKMSKDCGFSSCWEVFSFEIFLALPSFFLLRFRNYFLALDLRIPLIPDLSNRARFNKSPRLKVYSANYLRLLNLYLFPSFVIL